MLMFWHRCLILHLGTAAASLAPKLGDGTEVDWWFAYKLNTDSFPECSTSRACIFGGEVQDYKLGYGLQYLLSSHSGGSTTRMALKTDCLGSGDDPVAKTFEQIYGGAAANYVLWNDQFYREPEMKLDPPCSSWGDNPKSCSAPWAHSKGALAWDESGNGFVLQVTTPDWPGSGSKSFDRAQQGNTLGCLNDDNALVAQHFFALKLTPDDMEKMLTAMRKASVVTDPSNGQLVKLTNSPQNLASLVKGFGRLDTSTTPSQVKLSSGVTLIVKPQALNVPPWQMVSALLKAPLRTATWWDQPEIPSTYEGTPGCWSAELDIAKEVQIATEGQWQGKKFGLTGGVGTNYNHAKLGHSLKGNFAIMGDMNQQGSYTPEIRRCNSSQNGRGGMFFVVEDSTLHRSLKELMTGTTAGYYPSDPPSPSPTPPSPSPKPGPQPGSNCGGVGKSARSCREASTASGCVYVYSRDAAVCNVDGYGCFEASSLPSGCPEKSATVIV